MPDKPYEVKLLEGHGQLLEGHGQCLASGVGSSYLRVMVSHTVCFSRTLFVRMSSGAAASEGCKVGCAQLNYFV